MTKLTSDSNEARQGPLIGIVGGQGRMGQWFQRFFEDAGFKVLICDLDTELSAKDLARQCQVLVLSLPMKVFPEVVKEIGPLVPEDCLLTDLCSLKQVQVECMLRYSRCEVVGTHPLFGPGEDSISGRRVALCPGRGKRWFSWWEGLLKSHGAITHKVSPGDHDKIMAWVQALNHFILLTLGLALKEEEIDLKQLIALATPSFERQMRIVSRLCHQDPELYATIQMANPYTERALSTFTRHGEYLHNIVQEKDQKAFIRLFKQVQELGRFCEIEEKRATSNEENQK